MIRGILFCVLFLAAHVQPYVVNYEEDPTTTHRPLLGQKHCTRGPAYWCYNITQAKECSAVKHCINKVWESMTLPEDNDDVCTICKEMVKEARDQLLSNETQDELRQVLEGSCNLIPLKLVSKECCKLADDFIPELVDALTSRMDPQVVCAVSGLCNSVRIDEMLGQMKDIDEDGNTFLKFEKENFDLSKDSCPKCQHFLGKAVDSMKGMNKQDLLTKLFETCGNFGSYSDSCRAVVTKELDIIYNHVQNDMEPTEMCGLVGLCSVVSFHPVKLQSESTNIKVWTPPAKDDDLECDFCKQLVDHLRTWLTANTTRDEFHKVLTGLCQQTGKYKQECIGLADQYAGPLYDLLIEGMDPEEVCKQIGVCPSSIKGRVKLYGSATNASPIWTLLSVENNKDIQKLVPGERLTGDDEKNSHRPDFTYPMMKLEPGEDLIGNDEKNAILLETNKIEKPVGDILPTCPLCTFTVHKLIELIGKNRSKESIDHATESVCYVIPSRYKEQCLTFMREYGDKVVEMILIDGSAHEICAAIHLCLFSPKPAQPQKPPKIIVDSFLPFERYVPQVLVTKKKVESKQTCTLCEFVMTQLDSMLKDNSTEEEIRDTVEHVCDYLPKTVKDQCRAFVEEYGDMVINYLSQSLDPKEICTELKLCDATGVVDIELPAGQVEDKLKLDRCELCILLADYLSAFLEDPNVDTSVEKVIEKVCPLLPKDYTNDCKNMIEDYGAYILSLLAQETDKGKVCTTINLCPAA